MNKEKLIENWNELKDETKTKILALADKEIKEEYFVPKEGEKYYYWDIGAFEIETYSKTCEDTFLDKSYIGLGNCFKTEEENLFAGWCDYYTKRFETYVNRHTEKLDWGNDDQSKYYAFFNSKSINIKYDCVYISKAQGTTYASSTQILKDAIADIGEENFLKYVLKVEA